MTVAVAIFAHQEERRIATCLRSLPLDRPDTRFHVLVNGSADRTADIARTEAGDRPNVMVHDLHPGGKSRTWNRYIYELEREAHEAFLFLDGDARIAPGSIDALVAALRRHPTANAAAGMPLNGRSHDDYQHRLHEEGGLFGDLYALSGPFVEAIRARGLRLPDDLIGDDGLLAAFAMTGLRSDAHWDKGGIVPCDEAGFYCEPIGLFHPLTWRVQYRRMINYSVRFFQNRIISDIMKREGPDGLPPLLSDVYPDWLARFSPRPGITGWFDRKALEKMRAASRR